jgi:squalene cyclase
MNKESLSKAKEIIIKALIESDIEIIDKLELALNTNLFLNEEKYDNNIKVLRKANNRPLYEDSNE